jgi:hypothetical protein
MIGCVDIRFKPYLRPHHHIIPQLRAHAGDFRSIRGYGMFFLSYIRNSWSDLDHSLLRPALPVGPQSYRDQPHCHDECHLYRIVQPQPIVGRPFGGEDERPNFIDHGPVLRGSDHRVKKFPDMPITSISIIAKKSFPSSREGIVYRMR